MYELNFKPFKYQFKFQTQSQKTYIFDIVRKKYILLTPEEWVRQHVIHYLIEHKKVGLGLISVEKGLKYNNLQKRYDIKVYNNELKLLLLVECKAPTIPLTNETFLQSLTYAQDEKPRFIMLSNGVQHVFYDSLEKKFVDDFNLI